MKFIARFYIALLFGLIGFSFFQNCFDFELKLYETWLSPYFVSGIISRILLSFYFVVSVFWIFGKSCKLVSVVSIILALIPIYFFVFDSIRDEIIAINPILNLPSTFQIVLPLIGLFSVFVVSKRPLKILEGNLWATLTKYVLSVAMITIVFVVNPLFLDEFTDESAPFSSTEIQQIDLGEIGNRPEISAYFSTSCPYCEMASKRLKLLERNYSGFPEVKLFFLGSQERVNWFFEDTRTKFNYEILETEHFLRVTEGSFPKFIYFNKGEAALFYSGRTFNYYTPYSISEK